ncbi:hypothetical protein GEMRC1_005783 [Eukaryota sp. GEM-RC1]
MSRSRKDSDVSHATTAMTYSTNSVGHKFESKMFSLLQLSFEGKARYDFCALVLLLFEVVQIAGFVLNMQNFPKWDSLFDARLLNYFTLPLTAKEFNLPTWTVFASTMMLLGFLLLLLGLYFVFGHEHLKRSRFLPLIKASIHLFVGFLYFPILTILLSHLSCGVDSESFVTLIPP